MYWLLCSSFCFLFFRKSILYDASYIEITVMTSLDNNSHTSFLCVAWWFCHVMCFFKKSFHPKRLSRPIAQAKVFVTGCNENMTLSSSGNVEGENISVLEISVCTRYDWFFPWLLFIFLCRLSWKDTGISFHFDIDYSNDICFIERHLFLLCVFISYICILDNRRVEDCLRCLWCYEVGNRV